MDVTNALFKKVGDIFLSSKKRRDDEIADFLSFYRTIVEEMDAAVAAACGPTQVEVMAAGKIESWSIRLTVADYIWWKQKFADGVRFTKPVAKVKSDMLMRLAKETESNKLTAEERKALIALFDQ